MNQGLITKKEILDMGLDDYTGLYEIVWRLNTLWPDMDIGKKYQLADTALRELLSQNAVRIIKEISNNNIREYEPIDQEQIDQILRDPINWYPNGSEDQRTQFGYETTNIGERLYNDIYRKV